MTREEAINYFKRSFAIGEGDDEKYHNEVLEYTIKNLEQQEVLFKNGLLKDCESCKALEQQRWSLDDAREDFMHDVYNTLDFLPTNEEANRIIDSFDRVTKCIEQQPCEDAISRKELLSAFSDDDEPTVTKCCLRLTINHMPSVQPKPKVGRCKWIRYDYRTICPQNHDIDNPYWRIPENTECLKYCPYCGKEIEVTE